MDDLEAVRSTLRAEVAALGDELLPVAKRLAEL